MNVAQEKALWDFVRDLAHTIITDNSAASLRTGKNIVGLEWPQPLDSKARALLSVLAEEAPPRKCTCDPSLRECCDICQREQYRGAAPAPKQNYDAWTKEQKENAALRSRIEKALEFFEKPHCIREVIEGSHWESIQKGVTILRGDSGEGKAT